AKGAHTSLGIVGHPQPLWGEPVIERAAVTIAVAQTSDFAKGSLVNLLLDEEMRWASALKIARLKENASGVNRLRHTLGVIRAHTQWFLDKKMLACRCSR